jgi:hypothetical protein
MELANISGAHIEIPIRKWFSNAKAPCFFAFSSIVSNTITTSKTAGTTM